MTPQALPNPTWLCDIKAYRVRTSVNLDDCDLSTVQTESGKDFSRTQLQKAVNIPARNKLIVERILELHEGTRGVIFCVDVQHGLDLCEMANSMGLSARCIFGNTPKEERRRNFEDHKKGKFTALIGCGVFIEGYNDPGIGFIAMCRPTQSLLLYVQAIGRGLRPSPSPEKMMEHYRNGTRPAWVKPYCIIMDFCDLSSKHTIISIGSVFGLGSKFEFKGESVKKAAAKMQEELSKLDEKQKTEVEKHINDISSIEDMKSIVERINLLTVPTTPPEIQAISNLSWIGGSGKYEISLPGKDVIRISEDTLGNFHVDRSINGNYQTVEVTKRLESAVKWAEDNCIPPDVVDLLRAEAKWKLNRPSDKQIEYLYSLRRDMARPFSGDRDQFAQFVKANYSKGQIANLITEALGKRNK